MVPTCSNLFQLVPACSSLFQLVPTCSNLFQLVQTCSNLFKLVSITGNIKFNANLKPGQPPGTFDCPVEEEPHLRRRVSNLLPYLTNWPMMFRECTNSQYLSAMFLTMEISS